jgi:hypothetical protein
MNPTLLAALIGLTLLTVFIAYFALYHNRMLVAQRTKESDVKQDRIAATVKDISKFFDESEKQAKLQNLAAVNKLRAELEAAINVKAETRKSVAREQLKNVESNETDMIEEGGKLILSFDQGMKSALPSNEKEKAQDMTDLMAAVAALEDLDKDHYKARDSGVVGLDTGKGMLYDTISRKLGKLIKQNNYGELAFIQAEKLENEALDVVKNLEHRDYTETLKIMKQIGTIKDIIEVNPEVTLIVFSKTPVKITVQEKVVFSFAADEDILTVDRLQDKTKWEKAYLDKTLKSLETKGYLEIKDNNIILKGMATPEERKARAEKYGALKAKLAEKAKQEQELQQKQLEEQRKRKEEEEERRKQEMARQNEQLLKEAKAKAEVEAEELRKRAEKRAEEEERARLEKMKASPIPMIKTLPLPTKAPGSQSTPISPQPLPTTASVPSKLSDEAKLMAEEAKKLAEAQIAIKSPLTTPVKVEPTKVEPVKAAPAKKTAEIPAVQKSVAPVAVPKSQPPPPEISLDDMEMPDEEGFGEMDEAALAKFAAQAEAMSKMGDKEEGMVGDKSDALSNFFGDTSGDEAISDDYDELDQVIDEILGFLESQGGRTGGLISKALIQLFLTQAGHEEIKKAELAEIMDRMKEASLLYDEITIPGHTLYTFKDVVIDEEMKSVLKLFASGEEKTIKDLADESDWAEDKIQRVIERFEKQDLCRKTQDGKYSIPGIPSPTEQ